MGEEEGKWESMRFEGLMRLRTKDLKGKKARKLGRKIHEGLS